MKAAIIEDELNVQETLKSLLKEFCSEIEVITTATSIRSAIEKLKTHRPDIIFLDIHLPDGEGFDILNQLTFTPKIICTTAYESFAIEAIKHDVVDYLLKPIIPEELVEAVEKAQTEIEKEKKLSNFQENKIEKIILKTKEEIFRIKSSDLLYCEADGNYTRIHVLNEKPILLSKTLKKIEELLSRYGFLRVHQSFLVNPKHIKSLHKTTLLLSTGSEIKVSRRKKTELLEFLK